MKKAVGAKVRSRVSNGLAGFRPQEFRSNSRAAHGPHREGVPRSTVSLKLADVRACGRSLQPCAHLLAAMTAQRSSDISSVDFRNAVDDAENRSRSFLDNLPRPAQSGVHKRYALPFRVRHDADKVGVWAVRRSRRRQKKLARRQSVTRTVRRAPSPRYTSNPLVYGHTARALAFAPQPVLHPAVATTIPCPPRSLPSLPPKHFARVSSSVAERAASVGTVAPHTSKMIHARAP
jgi:hypothetical protein